MIVFNEKKFFDYTNPSYLSFIEKMLFVAYRIPHVDFNFSNKTLNVLIPILKKKSS
jgi:hypothetical protein